MAAESDRRRILIQYEFDRLTHCDDKKKHTHIIMQKNNNIEEYFSSAMVLFQRKNMLVLINLLIESQTNESPSKCEIMKKISKMVAFCLTLM